MSAASPLRTASLVVVFAGIAVAGLFGMRAVLGNQPTVVPSPTPTVTPSPTPPPPPQPEPFTVEIRSIRAQTMGNGRIFNRPDGKRTKAVGRTGRRAVRALERYLNAAFVDPTTRFTEDAFDGVFTPRAAETMRKRDRKALGVDLPPIVGGTTRKATARAIVLHRGGSVYAVTVKFRAAMDVLLAGADPQRLQQRGSMVFIRTANGWRADMADVQLRVPQRATGEDT